ncbi:MAG: transglutaminase domain-containing protein [Chitinophagaceae bacterium]
MKQSKLLFLSYFLVLAQLAMAQQSFPIVQAKSAFVHIKEDQQLRKYAWRIVPGKTVDTYTSSAQRISFITDLDSIRFALGPGITHEFRFVLNGKDTVQTRVVFQPTRLNMLKAAAAYDATDQRVVPKFGYQSASDTNLQRIRRELKLDSIAGNGSELSKIFNLMHWVHNLVKHDGNSNNPTLKNAIDLIKVCKQENRGVNCRMLATILNECYLSLGIRSRYITCMPKETQFDDCHVINMVFSRQLDKWIWIDPTFDAFVMDEKGQLLGIQEVRERLIQGSPLILNADANWNRGSLQTKENYLEQYMAKNLYRLQTPLVSEYDTETWKSGKQVSYVELLPLDGLEQLPQQRTQINTSTGVIFTYYKTNNPAIFWAKPDLK